MIDINTVDLIVFIILVASCLLGVVRGFSREFLGIISWVGSLFIMLYSLPYLRPLVAGYIESELLADIVVSFVVFAISLAILGTGTRLISSKVKSSILGGLDRSLGLVFGGVRAWVLFSLVYITAAFLVSPSKFPAAVRTAKSTPYIERGAHFLRQLVPDAAVKNVDWVLKSGKATREQPSTSKVVAALSHPVPKFLEPRKIGKKTERLSDIRGV